MCPSTCGDLEPGDLPLPEPNRINARKAAEIGTIGTAISPNASSPAASPVGSSPLGGLVLALAQ
jgi:hypothetical protein